VDVTVSAQEFAGMALPRDVIGIPIKLQPEKTIDLQIAGDLGTVEKTIEVHRACVMKKMGARSPAELARMGERLGIGVPDAKE